MNRNKNIFLIKFLHDKKILTHLIYRKNKLNYHSYSYKPCLKKEKNYNNQLSYSKGKFILIIINII